jgi:hypothetical protein
MSGGRTGGEHVVRVELLNTERARNVPERRGPAVPLKPVTPAGARHNREVLARALGFTDDYHRLGEALKIARGDSDVR